MRNTQKPLHSSPETLSLMLCKKDDDCENSGRMRNIEPLFLAKLAILVNNQGITTKTTLSILTICKVTATPQITNSDLKVFKSIPFHSGEANFSIFILLGSVHVFAKKNCRRLYLLVWTTVDGVTTIHSNFNFDSFP